MFLLDKYVLWKTRDKEVIDLPSHTVDENRKIWNFYDWSKLGEEWGEKTPDPEKWRSDLLEKMMFHYLQPDSFILEIGPGGGRWSQYLQKIARKLILVDIAIACLNLCKKRFEDMTNIEYHLIEHDNIDFLPSESIDYVWSYDVFVHINPSDVERYVANISRILKNNGIAIIHHSGGEYESVSEELSGFRSKLTADKFREYVTSKGMKMIEQNRDLVHKRGDIISVFSK
jgi:ubiquinone/menaquinone biosynthesis C-methylase UbiE